MDHDANDLATTDDAAADAVTSEAAQEAVGGLLIEEISIDGMCGVY